jgi:YbbR domain-containing protein
MSRVLKSRAFYIVFSILASVALWMFVEFMENPDIESREVSVPVEFVNRDLVGDRQLVITELSSESLALKFSGKRSTITELNRGGAVRVTVDLAQIKGSGQNKLDYNVIYGTEVDVDGLAIIYRSENYITVTVEAVYKKDVPISGSYTAGNIAMDGYQAEQMRFAPEMVTVSGPESVVARVEKAMVYVQRENLTKTVVEDMPYTLLDADGVPVPTDELELSRDTVTVTIPIKMVKDVPLSVKFSYGAGATEENVTYKITPETVKLAGEPDALNLNYVLLGTIDLTRFETFSTSTFQIILPNETQNLTGETSATVTVSIAGLETMHLSATDIQAVNVTEGYRANVITQSLDVTIRGKAETLELIRPENVHIVADLTDLGDTTGTYAVPARVYVDGDFKDADVGAIGEYKVTVTLSANTEG